MSTRTAPPPNLDGWIHRGSGKVRELYAPVGGGADVLMLVASNRVSAFDHVLEPEIPGKGALLTALSHWWFARLDVPNHLAGPDAPAAPAEVADRATVGRRLEMHPVECVVRGALTGSGFAEYEATGRVCGITLPPGLADGDLLDEPLYTPAFKAPLGAHDENITFDRSVELVGEDTAVALRETSLAIFTEARELVASRGLLLADTKFEFGRDPVGTAGTADTEPGGATPVLADEVLTSDSSRYWDADAYAHGATRAERLASFDKQIVRDWLRAHWDGTESPPALPPHIVERTRERTRELFDRLTRDG